MKTKFHFLIVFVLYINIANSQNGVWSQKNDIGFNYPNGPHSRIGVSSFAIDGKGYMGMGNEYKNSNLAPDYNDLWEYDTATNSWSQKANFIGNARNSAASFVINGKGYIGLGINFNNNDSLSFYNDFYEYNPNTNSWLKMADFPGLARYAGVSFNILDKGYVGLGRDQTSIFNDFWEYNPTNDTWIQKADFSGGVRVGSVGFGIGGKGFVGLGVNYAGYFKDLWEYNPLTNSWVQKADFGGVARSSAFGVSNTQLGLVGSGFTTSAVAMKDVWAYNPSTNIWSQKADFPDSTKTGAPGFSIGSKIYIGTDADWTLGGVDLWAYDVNNNTWAGKASFGSPIIPIVRNAFSSSGFGYVIAQMWDATSKQVINSLWQFDPTNEKWSRKTNLLNKFSDGVAFGVNGKGYFGTGQIQGITSNVYSVEMWEYNPSTDSWSQKADFPGGTRVNAIAFSIGSSGYVGTGYNASFLPQKDLWEYKPATNTWNQKADLPGPARAEAVGFSIGNRGYIGTGGDPFSQSYLNDFWEYNPTSNNWAQKMDLPGVSRRRAAGFAAGDKGYIGTGDNIAYYPNFNLKDFWEYSPTSNTWQQKADFIEGRNGITGIGVGGKGYFAAGQTENSSAYIDWWEFNPAGILPIKWKKFNVYELDKKAILKWQVETNANNNYFDIQVSEGGQLFSSLGKVPVAPNQADYSFEDGDFSRRKTDVLYYRIMQVDKDGRVDYSEVKKLRNHIQEFSFNIIGNVSKNSTLNISIQSPLANNGTIKIFDSNGRLILSKKIEWQSGYTEQPIHLPYLSQGVYFTYLVNGNNQYQQKFVR